jgi:hypothetical protein
MTFPSPRRKACRDDEDIPKDEGTDPNWDRVDMPEEDGDTVDDRGSAIRGEAFDAIIGENSSGHFRSLERQVYELRRLDNLGGLVINVDLWGRFTERVRAQPITELEADVWSVREGESMASAAGCQPSASLLVLEKFTIKLDGHFSASKAQRGGACRSEALEERHLGQMTLVNANDRTFRKGSDPCQQRDVEEEV